MALDTDLDDQDQAEVYDEETSGSDEDLETDYLLDRDTEDVTARRGDADLEGDDEEMDPADETDEMLADLDDAGEEDDLDDEGADVDALAGDDVQDFTADADFAADPDAEDGVAEHEPDEAEVRAMGDMTGYAAGASAADYESDELSDADLEELDYKQPPHARDDDAAADAATDDSPVPGKATVRHEDKRLDEGLEETFPASDPVSAKHIT